MKSHSLVWGVAMAFIWDGAYSEPQLTDPVAQGTSSGSNRSSNSYIDLERSAPGVVALLQQEKRRAYRDLFDSLELSEEEVDQLVNSLTEAEVLTSSWSTGELKHEPQVEDSARADAIMADIEAMLSHERFALFTAYRDTLHERSQVRRLDERLYSAARPLSAEQEEQIVNILVAERDKLLATPPDSPSTLEETQQFFARLNDIDLYLQKLLGSVLTAEQLKIARSYFAAQAQRRHEALERYREDLAAGIADPSFWFPAD